MVRSLLGIVLALAIIGAPLASVACEATCAARDAQAPISHHSCHQQTPSDQRADIAAIHFCGHDDGVQTAVERGVQSLVPPAVVPTIDLAFTSRPITSLPIATFHPSPPTPLNRISQLRI
jgi:hypothetical protein